MATPTPHSALEGLGFHLAGRWNTENGATVHHYMQRGAYGLGRPVNHHVSVAEWPEKPGKYNVYYQVMHDNAEPFDDRVYDDLRRHSDNVSEGGVADPIREIGKYHQQVVNHLRQLPAPKLQAITPQNVHTLAQRPPMVHLNAVEDESFDEDEPVLDPHEAFAGGEHPEFDYHGDDGETRHYGVTYPDPKTPGYGYTFSVRHLPSAEPEQDDLAGKPIYDEFGDDTGVNHLPVQNLRARQFSYNVTHHPLDVDENGEFPVGDFADVVGNGSWEPDEGGFPVATFTNPQAVLDRHHSMLRSLGLMPKLAPNPEDQVNKGQFAKRADLARLIMESADEDLLQRRN